MDVYEIKFKENHKVSLVKDPAIEMTLLKFNNETEDVLYFANEEKKIIYSVAMVPNKLIFRKDVKGKPANVFYSAETIEEFQQNYFRTNANNGTNINHASFNTEGVFPFESWIVANSENDKSNELGLNAPNGSLIMGFKIDNPEVWQEVKAGNIDGISVEGNVIFEQQTNIKMTKDKESFFSHVKAYFMEHDDEEKNKEVEKMAEHDLPDPAADPAVNPDAAADAPTDDHAEEMNKMKEQIALLEEKVSMMEAEKVKDETSLTTMKSEKEKAEADLVNFKNERPATEAIKNVPVETFKSEKDMSPLEKFRASKNN
jgi:hypothetical protein